MMAENELSISILVVSGSSMAGDLYSESLNRRAGFLVVAHAASVDEAILVVRSINVDIVLVSTTLADGPHSALAALPRIQAARPSLKAVVLLQRTEADLIVSAFRAGARGVFFPAIDGFQKLCRCIEKVNEGQVWANNSQLLQVLEVFSRQAPLRMLNPDGIRLLTKREEQVVQLIEEGFTNRQIASELHLSEHTVRNNLFRIFDKLGVSSRVELALYRVNSSNRFAEEARREIRKPVVSASVFNPTEHSRQRLYGSRAVRQLPETF
ncbi:MAG: response regulator transcription factor [Terracidiphilus sp.]